MPSEEEKRRRRARNQSGVRSGMSTSPRVQAARAVRPYLRSAWDSPQAMWLRGGERYTSAQDDQLAAEKMERAETLQAEIDAAELGGDARVRQGLGRMGPASREALSTGIDFLRGIGTAAGMADMPLTSSAMGVAEKLSEWIDPSTDTTIGREQRKRFQDFAQNKGRQPNVDEKASITYDLHDEYYPGVFDKPGRRGKQEIAYGLGIGLAETAATGGVSTVGKAAAKGIAKAAQKTSIGGVRKGLETTSKGVRVASHLPRALEDLAGAMISKPLGLGLRGVRYGATSGIRLTTDVFNKSLNTFRRRARERGFNPEDIDAVATDLGNQANAEGRILPDDDGTTWSPLQMFDAEMDMPAPPGQANVQVGISPATAAHTYEPGETVAQRYTKWYDRSTGQTAIRLLKSDDEATQQEGAKLANKAVANAKTYVEQTLNNAGFVGLRVEPNRGMYEGVSEPSVYVRGNIPEDRFDEFTNLINDIGDIDFGQDSVLSYRWYTREEAERAFGNYDNISWKQFTGIGQYSESIEPATSFLFKQPLTESQMVRVNEMAEQADLFGMAIRPNMDGIDFVNVRAYNDTPDDVMNFITRTKKMEDLINGDSDLRGIFGTRREALARVRHTTRNLSQPDSGAIRYGEYRGRYGATDKAGKPLGELTEETKARLSDEHYQSFMAGKGQSNLFGIEDIPNVAAKQNPDGTQTPLTTGRIGLAIYDRLRKAAGSIPDQIEQLQLSVQKYPRLAKLPIVKQLTQVRARTQSRDPMDTEIGRIGNAARNELNKADDQYTTRIEAVRNLYESKMATYIAALERAGVLVKNIGGKNILDAARRFDAAGNSLESGDTMTHLVTGNVGLGGNFSLTDNVFKNTVHENVEDMTFKGHTLVSDRYEGFTRPDMVDPSLRVAPDLTPGFNDVGERLPLYRIPLEAVEDVIEEGGRKLNAYEVFEEIVAMARKVESERVNLGQKGVRTGRGVLYDGGGAYMPRLAQGQITGGRLPTDRVSIGEITLNDMRASKANTISSREFLSQAEGMLSNEWYAHPASAMGDFVKSTGALLREAKMGAFLQRTANQFGLTSGTAKSITGSESIAKQITLLQRKLNSVINRQRRAKTKGTAALLSQANNLMHEIKNYDVKVTMLNSEAENQADVLADWDINIGNDIAKWASAIEELAGKRFLDESEIVSIRKNLAQLRETQANISKRNRKNYRSFETYGLEGQYFPVQFYDATAKTIMREIKDPHIASLVLRNIQSMMRLTGATADMSALGIQGWQALMLDVAKTTGRVLPQDQNKKLLNYNRSAPSMQAFKAMAKAFWGEDGKKVVQEYFLMKDAMAVKTGMMTPMQKAQSGLAILHNAPDLDLGLAGRVPVIGGAIAPFDRMFTHYGNVLRDTLMDIEIESLMVRSGKSIDEIIASGEAAEIAKHLNVLTGVGRRIFGFKGEAAQWLLFAPRYFMAQATNLGRAAQGSLPTRNKALSQRLAAKHMWQFIGITSFITIAGNEVMGKETDINPFIRNDATGKWTKNSNFMRLHLGNTDIDLMGPLNFALKYASILPLMAVNRFSSEASLEALSKEATGVFSAPGTRLLVDILAKENAIGEKVDKTDWSTYITRFVPFSADELIYSSPGTQAIWERTVAGARKLKDSKAATDDRTEGALEIGTGITQAGMNILGVKSSYESPTEMMQSVMAEVLDSLTEQDKRDLFGVDDGLMTMEEVEEIFSSAGSSVVDKFFSRDPGFDISLVLRGDANERTIPWSDIARDVQKNINDRLESGGFGNILTAEESEEIRKRTRERLENSASDYAKYTIERDAIIDAEQVVLDDIEKQFTAIAFGKVGVIQYTDPETGKKSKPTTIRGGDFVTFIRSIVQPYRSQVSKAKRAVSEPYQEMFDSLFAPGRQNALEGTSSFDKDLFDTVQASYYDILYDDKDGIIMADGTIDWDKKDEKIKSLVTQMKARFPDIQDGRVKRMITRVERNARREAPPLITAYLDMQEHIGKMAIEGDSTFYDIEKLIIADAKARYPDKVDKIDKEYRAYESAHYSVRSQIAAQYPWLKDLSDAKNLRLNKLFYKNQKDPKYLRLEGILVVMKKRSTPITDRGQRVKELYDNHVQGIKPIQNYTQFILDVYNGNSLQEYLGR